MRTRVVFHRCTFASSHLDNNKVKSKKNITFFSLTDYIRDQSNTGTKTESIDIEQGLFIYEFDSLKRDLLLLFYQRAHQCTHYRLQIHLIKADESERIHIIQYIHQLLMNGSLSIYSAFHLVFAQRDQGKKSYIVNIAQSEILWFYAFCSQISWIWCSFSGLPIIIIPLINSRQYLSRRYLRTLWAMTSC